MSTKIVPILSKDNIKFKHWLKVATQKTRDQVCLEGEHLAQMLIAQSTATAHYPIDCLVFAQSKVNRYQAYLSHASHAYVLPDMLFERLCQTPSPQGILAFIQRPQPILTFIPETCLLLDRIQDPGNMGSLLRIAAAAGIEHIYLSKGCANPWSAKVLRAAQGAHFSLSLHENIDLSMAMIKLDMPIFATILDQHASNLYQTNLPKDIAWLMGNEGQGISPELLEHVSQGIFIPQSPAVESLNVSIACALALYEQRRQHDVY